jgi:hypothetical protein
VSKYKTYRQIMMGYGIAELEEIPILLFDAQTWVIGIRDIADHIGVKTTSHVQYILSRGYLKAYICYPFGIENGYSRYRHVVALLEDIAQYNRSKNETRTGTSARNTH